MNESYLQQTYPFTLPELPYASNALEPSIDSRTMEIHHGKHHAGYVTKLNSALESTLDLQSKTIRELLLNPRTLPDDVRQSIINNGGGHINHALYWRSMSANAGMEPTGQLFTAINDTFGDFSSFIEKFTEVSILRFGSGWAWLSVEEDGSNMMVHSTANQDSPLSEHRIPILGLDLWEHAYYLNYQNRRNDYIAAWWNVVDWKSVAERFAPLRS